MGKRTKNQMAIGFLTNIDQKFRIKEASGLKSFSFLRRKVKDLYVDLVINEVEKQSK